MKKSQTNTSETIDYAALRAELDELLISLESGELDVDEAVQQYQRGLELIHTLQSQLLSAENRVQELRDEFESKLQPATDTTEEE